MPTALVIQHGVDSPPGMIGEAAAARGFELVPYISEAGTTLDLPNPSDADIVIVTGSIGHWYEIEQHPHLQTELAFLEKAIETSTPVIGMCFGGQALSLALGGTVEDTGSHEIGWIEVDTSDESTVPRGPWFAWHYDRFSLPPGGELLARTDFSLHAFRSGPHLGLQFHPEVTYDMLAEWESWIPADVDADAFVRQTKDNEAQARPRAYALFDTFLSFQN